MVHGQHQAQKVDQDPEEVKNVMAVRTLAKKQFSNTFYESPHTEKRSIQVFISTRNVHPGAIDVVPELGDMTAL